MPDSKEETVKNHRARNVPFTHTINSRIEGEIEMNEWFKSSYDEWEKIYNWLESAKKGIRDAACPIEGLPLEIIWADFIDMIQPFPKELPALRAALVEGRIDGDVYVGECSCLVGTIAVAGYHRTIDEIPNLKPDMYRPAEMFAGAIFAGDTPETNPVSAYFVQWIDDYTAAKENYKRLIGQMD